MPSRSAWRRGDCLSVKLLTVSLFVSNIWSSVFLQSVRFCWSKESENDFHQVKVVMLSCEVHHSEKPNVFRHQTHVSSSCCCVFVFFMFLPSTWKCLHQDSERSGFWRPVSSGQRETSFSHSWTQISRGTVIKYVLMKVKGLIVSRDEVNVMSTFISRLSSSSSSDLQHITFERYVVNALNCYNKT